MWNQSLLNRWSSMSHREVTLYNIPALKFYAEGGYVETYTGGKWIASTFQPTLPMRVPTVELYAIVDRSNQIVETFRIMPIDAHIKPGCRVVHLTESRDA